MNPCKRGCVSGKFEATLPGLAEIDPSEEEEQELGAKHRDWRLTEALMRLTNNARFIHVMPFDRGNEVDDSVADGPSSLVYEQAENLLHVRKAFLASILADPVSLKKL